MFLLLRGFLLTSSPSLFTLNLKSAFSRVFSFRKLQIFISFRFANYSKPFVSQTTVSRLKALNATGNFNQAAKFRIKLLHTYPEPAVFVDSMLSIRSLFAILFVFGLWDVSPVLYVSTLGPCHLSSLSGPMLSLSIVVILGEPVVDSRYLIDSSG